MITTIRNWFKPAAISGAHERIAYKPGRITMEYRLLPQHQAEIEQRLDAIGCERDAKVNAATASWSEIVKQAKADYETAMTQATNLRDRAIKAAEVEYDAHYRAALKQFGKAPTAEELALATTKPGQVIDLRNAAPARA